MISGFRPRAPIVAITHSLDPLNRMELIWGIQTYKIRTYQSAEDALAQIEELLLKIGLVSKGDKIVLTMGMPVQQGAKTNTIRVHTISKDPIDAPDSELPLRRRKDMAALLKGI
jgi:pyruvate kinase